jgi:chromosome segregation ATPase
MTLEQHKQAALSFLAAEGQRLGSTMLVATAMKLGPDPFKKVKELIQKLIERLLKEMAAEAGHKGFCDTELGKAKTSRDFEHERTQKLSAELSELEVKQEQLAEEIETLKKELKDLNKALDESTEQRDEEKEENSATIKDSTEGMAAIHEAITVLKEFYKNAAKNKVLLLELQASPIDEEGGVGAGGQAQGAYKGNQAAGGGIIAMLEVIAADFDRSVRQTTEADAEAHKAFVLFDRQSKGSISQKETRQKQAEGDLKTTKMAIEDAMADLTDSQSLLDDALKAIEELKPQCIDTGMSYEERVAAREKEIEALKKALCMLDPEGVEPDC